MGKATLIMREYDPKFDMYELEQEAGSIFKVIYEKYLQQDQKWLD